jgi:adenylate cyclase
MDLLSRIASWLGENEATISAVVGITVLAGVVFAGLRSVLRRRSETAQATAPGATATELAPAASEAPAADLDPLTVPGFEGRPAIAVLPFDNLSGDPEQEYFADGFADELITLLSALPEFPVIARNSSFTYKGKPVDVKQIGRELGVHYVVEGSVRKTNDRIRITAQLIDATTGGHVWAETYDRHLRDIFEIQDEITEAIAGSMGFALLESEAKRAIHKEPQNLDARDFRMRGNWHMLKSTKEDNRKAQALFRQAIELDPEYAEAFSDLAFSHYFDNLRQWTDSPARSLTEQLEAAENCLRLDNTHPWGHWALAWVHSLSGQRDQAIAAAELAVEFLPSFAEGHQALGLFLIMTGRYDEGIAHQEKAIRLAPKTILTSYCMHCISLGHFGAGRYEKSVEWEQRALQRTPDYWISLGTLTSSYAHLGRMEEARSTLEKMLRANPDYSEDGFRMIFAIADADYVERWLGGIRKAGWEG